MNANKNENVYFFQSSVGLFQTYLDDEKSRSIPQYIDDGNGSVTLNPEWQKVEQDELDEWERDFLADLDEAQEPAAPDDGMETAPDDTPLEAIPTDDDGDNSTELADLDADNDSLAGLSTSTLIDRHKRLFSGDFEYTDTLRALNREIALELTKRGIPPIDRDFLKYDRIACDDSSIAAYMLDVQAFDLLWVWATQRGHKVDSEAYDGLLAGIFSGDNFDFNKAAQIAKIRKDAKGKVELLRLPEVWQEQLLILRTDAIRQRQDEAKKRTDREQKRLDKLRVQAIDVRAKLESYKASTPRARLSVDVYMNVWLARSIAGDSKTYLIDTMENYENLTGESIEKSDVRQILRYLDNALKS